MTSETPLSDDAVALREKIARIIDPSAWAFAEAQQEAISRLPNYTDEDRARFHSRAEAYKAPSLEKADATLQAIEGEG